MVGEVQSTKINLFLFYYLLSPIFRAVVILYIAILLARSITILMSRGCVGFCLLLILLFNVIMEGLVMITVEVIKEKDVSQAEVRPEFIYSLTKLTLGELYKMKIVQCCELLIRLFKCYVLR